MTSRSASKSLLAGFLLDGDSTRLLDSVSRFVPPSVAIHNLHLVGIVAYPLETDAPLVIDANTVLALSITRERFQMVSRRGSQVIKPRGEADLRKFSKRDATPVRGVLPAPAVSPSTL